MCITSNGCCYADLPKLKTCATCKYVCSLTLHEPNSVITSNGCCSLNLNMQSDIADFSILAMLRRGLNGGVAQTALPRTPSPQKVVWAYFATLYLRRSLSRTISTTTTSVTTTTTTTTTSYKIKPLLLPLLLLLLLLPLLLLLLYFYFYYYHY